MDIIVGATAHANPSRSKATELSGPARTVEARVLSVRPGRSGAGYPQSGTDKRRRRERNQDPSSGSVLLLLVPEGTKLPKDIESDNYRVFVRVSNK